MSIEKCNTCRHFVVCKHCDDYLRIHKELKAITMPVLFEVVLKCETYDKKDILVSSSVPTCNF